MAIDGRSARKTLVINPGPYEALVVSLLDPKRMGAIQVELLKNSTLREHYQKKAWENFKLSSALSSKKLDDYRRIIFQNYY